MHKNEWSSVDGGRGCCFRGATHQHDDPADFVARIYSSELVLKHAVCACIYHSWDKAENSLFVGITKQGSCKVHVTTMRVGWWEGLDACPSRTRSAQMRDLHFGRCS
jgi:hypothetical protein